MEDRLVSLLKRFELRAQVFQAGPLCHSAEFNAGDDLGYIHVLRAGAIRLHSDGRRAVKIDQPCVLFYMTPTTHRLVPLGTDTDTVCASFEFGIGLHNPLLKALPDLVHITLADLPNMATTLELLFKEAMENHCGRQAIIDRMTEVLIVLLLRELMDQGRLESGLLAGLSDPRLAKAINALHADPASAWSLDSLADVANMSRARFAVHFRETVGMTPMLYLSEWRLSVAQSLLRRGWAVQSVADQVGYASASALSRAFTAQLGLSPSKWRRRQVSD